MSENRALSYFVVLVITQGIFGYGPKLPCARVYHLLKNMESISNETACVSVLPGTPPTFHFLFGSPNPVYGHYIKMAKKFLSDVSMAMVTSSRMHFTRELVLVASDDSTLPLSITQFLFEVGVPLLAHAVHGVETFPFIVLGPDFHFIEHDGFNRLEQYFNDHGKPFLQRKPAIFWRGSTTGYPCRRSEISLERQHVNCREGCMDLQRVQLAVRASKLPWLDAGLVQTVQYCSSIEASKELQQMGLLKSRVDESIWSEYRGMMEIDGNVNAWGNRWRLVSGSVLFRVQSNFTNSYIRYQKPWVHFVPVQADLSDLETVTALIQSSNMTTLRLLQGISENAAALGRTFSYRSEVRRVCNELISIWYSSRRTGKLSVHRYQRKNKTNFSM